MENSTNDDKFDDTSIRFRCETGVDICPEGNDTRKWLVREVLQHWESLSKRAVHLLVSFMKHSGVFELNEIEVFAAKTDEGGDFSLRHTFTADHDPHEYGYTYFEVIFGCREPPVERFWPFKFIVGFH